MKNKIIILFAIGLTYNLGLLAQNKKHSLSYFIVDGISNIEVVNCVPKSTIDFYSKPGGGKFMQEKIADEKGMVLFQITNETMPAFCSSRRIANNVQGTGAVIHFKEYDFNLSYLEYFLVNNENQITWKCAIPSTKNATFEIWKSIGSGAFQKIATIDGTPNNQINEYSFKEDNNQAEAVYQLRVISDKTQKYVSKNIVFNLENTFELYPTLSVNHIFIENRISREKRSYKILNQSGQYISSGLLNSSLNKLDISNFSVGAYFVQIENQKEILKFIKL